MKRIDYATQLRKDGDFAMRSCWECNPAHEQLKYAAGLFACFDCGRWWIDGDYLTDENNSHCEAERV